MALHPLPTNPSPDAVTPAAPAPRAVRATSYEARALWIWPRLDRSRLRRMKGDPVRIARLVERRTALSLEQILRLLGAEVSED